jgi:hypothetical protein
VIFSPSETAAKTKAHVVVAEVLLLSVRLSLLVTRREKKELGESQQTQKMGRFIYGLRGG